jgi:hypothetical protein
MPPLTNRRSPLFRRAKTETAADAAPGPEPVGKPQGKGRPTPSRKEAEAAARARAKAALDPKASRREQRRLRAERSAQARSGMKQGDARYLPARDQGPVKAFVRDFVDTRLNMAEFAVPILFASLVLSSLGQPALGSALINALMLVVVLDSLFLRWRMRRELQRRFPDESLKGTTFYAFMRALQLRFLRLPKPRVKLGQQLPERY